MKLPFITIGEYCQLTNDERKDYDFAIKYSEQSEAKDVLLFGDITKKTFGEVKDWQQLFSDKESFVKFLTMFDEKLLTLDVFSFFAFYRYVESEVVRVSEIEQKLLSHEPTADEVAAGIDRFNKFGVAIQIDNLAKGDITKWEAIRKMPYEHCLLKLVMDKTANDFTRDYQELMLKKQKNG
jgi:hypothetical protein